MSLKADTFSCTWCGKKSPTHQLFLPGAANQKKTTLKRVKELKLLISVLRGCTKAQYEMNENYF